MDVVTICKRKRPEGSGTWAGHVIGVDGLRTWVYTPQHSIYCGEDRSGAGACEVAQDLQGQGRHSVVLLPADGWFVAHWVLGAEHLVSIDISTPPKKLGSTWTFDDLELDPYVTGTGIFGVEDEDEFDAALADGFVDEPEAKCARHAVDWFRRELTGGSSPFVEAGLQRLADAVKTGLPPLHLGA